MTKVLSMSQAWCLHQCGSWEKFDLKAVELTWIKGGIGSFLNNTCFMLTDISLLTVDFLFCYILGPLFHIVLHQPQLMATG